jgi:surface polysaccharide O-acyltransferase-like enzyme
MDLLQKKAPFESVRSEQTAWIDLLRLFSVFAVVVLHAAVPFVLGFGRISKIDWLYGNIIDSSVRWSVPLFVIISGALLLNPKRHESFSAFYRKKISRILLPLLFWSAVYSAMTSVFDFRAHNIVSIKNIIGNFIIGRPYPHLWYLFMLLGLYALTPLLRLLLRILTELQTAVFIMILVIAGMLFAIAPQTNYETGNIFFLWSLQFLGYFVLGGVAYKKKLWEKINKYVLAFIYCLSVAVTATGCWYLSTTMSLNAGLKLYNYTSPSVVIMAVTVFFLAAKAERWLSTIAVSKEVVKTTLGIYLIHPLILFVLFYFNAGNNLPSLLTIFITGIISFILSLAATLLFQRIPFLKLTV